jgi:hypothetical protein
VTTIPPQAGKKGVMRVAEYKAKCRECGKAVKDSEAIYVVATDEYFCDQKCLDTNAKKEFEKNPTDVSHG